VNMLQAPNWVLYAMDGHSCPVARLLAFRDAVVECGRYVRRGRSRELAGILRRKVWR
jgi:hypothetical protein